MSESAYKTAVLDVEAELGPDLYALAPKADYLVADATLISAASVMLGFVLNGLTDGIRRGLTNWGKDAGESLVKRVRELFTSASDRTSDDALHHAEDQVKGAVEALMREAAQRPITTDVEAVVGYLVAALVEAGMTPSAARRYGETVQASTIHLLEATRA